MLKTITKRHARLLFKLNSKLNLFDSLQIFVPVENNKDVRLIINGDKIFNISGRKRLETLEYFET